MSNRIQAVAGAAALALVFSAASAFAVPCRHIESKSNQGKGTYRTAHPTGALHADGRLGGAARTLLGDEGSRYRSPVPDGTFDDINQPKERVRATKGVGNATVGMRDRNPGATFTVTDGPRYESKDRDRRQYNRVSGGIGLRRW